VAAAHGISVRTAHRLYEVTGETLGGPQVDYPAQDAALAQVVVAGVDLISRWLTGRNWEPACRTMAMGQHVILRPHWLIARRGYPAASESFAGAATTGHG
jgi:hypothetical protein